MILEFDDCVDVGGGCWLVGLDWFVLVSSMLGCWSSMWGVILCWPCCVFCCACLSGRVWMLTEFDDWGSWLIDLLEGVVQMCVAYVPRGLVFLFCCFLCSCGSSSMIVGACVVDLVLILLAFIAGPT